MKYNFIKSSLSFMVTENRHFWFQVCWSFMWKYKTGLRKIWDFGLMYGKILEDISYDSLHISLLQSILSVDKLKSTPKLKFSIPIGNLRTTVAQLPFFRLPLQLNSDHTPFPEIASHFQFISNLSLTSVHFTKPGITVHLGHN